ncbi:MAG: signal peptidase I [Actinobacteria bacterium]|nr:signal peptidase I [Actinomycetota bacterium]
MSRLLRFGLIVLSIVGVLLVLAAITSKLYRIPTSSMEPTLHCPRGSGNPGCLGEEHDRIAVSKVLYRVRDPERGDIVAYRLPRRAAGRCGAPDGSTFVHRIIGLPGESVAVRDGVVFVDGRKLTEPYIEAGRRDRDSSPAREISKDQYLVLGDNRAQSCDSRVWGLVARDRLIGPKIATYWPWARISIR